MENGRARVLSKNVGPHKSRTHGDDLRRAREEAERANHAKDEFLAVVAHELKQPLSAMLPAVSLIRHRLSPESLASNERTLDLLNRQITHLQRVVNDLLDASRVVRGQVTLQPRVVDAFQIMRDAVEVIRPRAQERRQRLVLDVSGSAATLNVDPVRLQQVLLCIGECDGVVPEVLDRLTQT